MDLPPAPGTPPGAAGSNPLPSEPAPTQPDASQPDATQPAGSQSGASAPDGPRRRWLAARVLPIAVAAGVGVLALVVGTGPGPLRLPGLPSSGTGTYWALPMAQLVGRIAAVATLGWLLTAAVLLPAARSAAPKALGATAHRCGRHAADAAVVWLVATLAELVLTLSEVSARPAGDVLDRHALRLFVTSTGQGRALLIVAVLAAAIAIIARTVTTTTAAGALLVVAGAALLPPILTGHAASSGDHAVAVVALAVHVLAATTWVGGLLGLLSAVRLPVTSFGPALRRYSRLAALAAASTAVTGIGSAALRLGGVAPLWQTRYGVLVLLKAVGLIAAVALGAVLRRRVVDHLDPPAASTLPASAPVASAPVASTTGSSPGLAANGLAASSDGAEPSDDAVPAAAPGSGRTSLIGRYVQLAGVELTMLVATFGLAVGLARTAPPVNDAYVPNDPTRALLGYPMPPPVTAWRLALDWRLDWVFLAGCVLGAGAYLAAVLRLRARGDRWPIGRTIAWFVGLFVVVAATCSGLGRYGPVLLSVHMTQHMLLNMVAPIPLVLGAPVTLALRALRPARAPHRSGPREWLVAGLHSWPVRFLTHPVVVSINFVGGLYVLYLTSLLSTLMSNHLGHLYMNVHFLAVGLLFFELIIGIDPLPRRLPHPGRILMLIAIVPFHTFLGLTIMGTSNLLGSGWYDRLVRPWGSSPLSDQHTAGGIAWSFGELPTFTVLLVLVAQWARTDDRRNRNRERRIAAAGDVDAELDAYNAYLARLSARPGGGQLPPTGMTTVPGPIRPPRPREAADNQEPPARGTLPS
ncbi:cytochrome c oxidase assembly protein [Frankia sp. R82]|uniref:cytochrome c oxidase assembly protein n=1 Tax=Frankia sp. R82 TaxID=2950553 RepID=UPI0020445FAE|nr:cytochrome c oxidase assembly protein [Frankia sp. R82]MCM3885032.1 bifunctional copper resistance protein CopD/cytochrome c oxidase assembly protein [Frankia sp. R82]